MSNYLAALRLFSRDMRYFLLASALHGFVFFGIYALLLNLYLLRLGYGPSFIGMTNAVGPLALAVMSLPAGALSRRIGSRRALIMGYFFTAIGLTLVAMGEAFPTPWSGRWIMASYGLAWLAGALIVVNMGPYIMGSTTPTERSHAFSVQSAVLPVSGFVGNLVGGLLPGLIALALGMSLADAAPYRYALIAAGLLDFLAVVAMWQTREVAAAPPTLAGAQRRSPMPALLIGVVAGVWMLRVGSEWTMRVFFNVYLDTELGVSTALIGALLAVGQLLGLAALFAPYAITRYGAVRTIVGGMVGMALAFLPLILISHWLAVGAGFVMMMALISLSGPAYSLFSQELVAQEWRTTISSVMSMSLGFGIALVAFGGGYVILWSGYDALFFGGALLAALGALIFGVFFRKPRGEMVTTPIEL